MNCKTCGTPLENQSSAYCRDCENADLSTGGLQLDFSNVASKEAVSSTKSNATSGKEQSMGFSQGFVKQEPLQGASLSMPSKKIQPQYHSHVDIGMPLDQARKHQLKNQALNQSIHHPFLRALARGVDGFLITAPFIFLLAYSVHQSRPSFMKVVILILLFNFLSLLVEALFLSSFGTTPGKWIFNIKVLDSDANKLSFGAAFMRAFSIVIYGMFRRRENLKAFQSLRATGYTPWDREHRHLVVHEPWGFVRISIGILLMSAVIIFSVKLYYMGI